MHVAKYLKRPVFEVLQFPETELDYWSCYFSIENNQEQPTEPTLTEEEQRERDIEKSMAGFAAIFGGDDGQSTN